jgi:hypothetical protein
MLKASSEFLEGEAALRAKGAYMSETAIRIRFVASKSFIGEAIRKVTGSLFEHVEFGTPEGTWIGAHAGAGVQERPANYALESREYIYDIPCTLEQQMKLLTWARSKIGIKYNYWDIIGLLFQNRSLQSPQRYICSEFCTEGLLRVFGASKILNVLIDWTYRITPETLHLSPILVGHLTSRKDAATKS